MQGRDQKYKKYKYLDQKYKYQSHKCINAI